MNSVTTNILLCLFASLQSCAWAQTDAWPTHPITINVGHAGGGSYDIMARKIAEGLTSELGQPVIVQTRSGAGGIVMVQAIGRSKPDGYQIGLSTSLNMTLDAQAGVVPFKADSVEPLVSVGRFQSVLVAGSKQPFSDMAGLIAYTKNKGYAQFGHQALVDELVVRNVMKAEKVQFDLIPYKGGIEVRLAAMQGQINFGYVGAGYKANVDSGDLKILATTDANRLAAFPQVPTLKELGYPISEESVGLFVVPAGTPDQVKDRLATAITRVVSKPEFKSFLADTLFLVPETKRGAELKASLKAQEEQWAKLLATTRNAVVQK